MKVISLFSGAGGMDIGFEQAGFEIVVAVEKDSACCDTLKKNRPNLKVLEADIAEISGKEILKVANLQRNETALVIGGPPCQSFSLAGKREGLNDDRGLLVMEFVRLVKEILPVGFVMENVKGMANWEKGQAIREIIKSFEAPITFNKMEFKYDVKQKVMNGANYGLPQFRERLFLVGNRLGVNFVFPEPTHGPQNSSGLFNENLKPYTTVWEAIGTLPSANEPSENAKRIANTIKKRIELHGY